MLLLKSCPHCHGDLAFDQDARTAYLYCVQCGHILSAAQERALGVHATRHGLTHLPARRGAPTSQPEQLATASAAR